MGCILFVISVVKVRGLLNGLIVECMWQFNFFIVKDFVDYVGIGCISIYDFVWGCIIISGIWIKFSFDILIKFVVVFDKFMYELFYLIDFEVFGVNLMFDVQQVLVYIVGQVGVGLQQFWESSDVVYVEWQFVENCDLIVFIVVGDSMVGG